MFDILIIMVSSNMLILKRSTVGGRRPLRTDYNAARVNSVQHVGHHCTMFSAYECGLPM